MAIIKIHIASTISPYEKPVLVKEVHQKMLDLFNVENESQIKVLLFETLPQFMCANQQLSIDFATVEVFMKNGSNSGFKKTIADEIISIIIKYTTAKKEEVVCTIIELSEENYYN